MKDLPQLFVQPCSHVKNIHTGEENRLATELHKSLQGCLLNCLMKQRPCGVLVEVFTLSDEVLCSKLDESVNAELSQ